MSQNLDIKPEVDAEIVLLTDTGTSTTDSQGFFVFFNSDGFSASVLPNGSSGLKPLTASRVRLQFLVPSAAFFLESGANFTFFEEGRTGYGQIL